MLSGGRAPPPQQYSRKFTGPVADIQVQPKADAGERGPPPRHVAIIMDGNGRWANRRGLPGSVGHIICVEALPGTVRVAMQLVIAYLTSCTSPWENWSRPADEVSELIRMMKRFVRMDLVDLHHSGVRIRVIGERNDID